MSPNCKRQPNGTDGRSVDRSLARDKFRHRRNNANDVEIINGISFHGKEVKAIPTPYLSSQPHAYIAYMRRVIISFSSAANNAPAESRRTHYRQKRKKKEEINGTADNNVALSKSEQ